MNTLLLVDQHLDTDYTSNSVAIKVNPLQTVQNYLDHFERSIFAKNTDRKMIMVDNNCNL